jgi:hypothetical protein
MQSADGDELLGIATRLLDSLIDGVAVARVTGPPVEYIVNQAPHKIIVSLLNHKASEWKGQIAVNQASGVFKVTEYMTDQPVDSATRGRSFAGSVPPYGVRVYGIAYKPGVRHDEKVF